MSEKEITFFILGRKSVQRGYIQQGIYPRRASTLQTNRNFLVQELLYSPNLLGVKKGFIKGEALKLLRILKFFSNQC